MDLLTIIAFGLMGLLVAMWIAYNKYVGRIIDDLEQEIDALEQDLEIKTQELEGLKTTNNSEKEKE